MRKYLSLIKFSHTVFALPFALVGYFLGVNRPDGQFEWRVLFLVLLCMVFARSAAMAFNRYADWRFDRQNPRTASREIPAGIISPRSALIFTLLNSLLFIGATWFINPLCFYLSPVALLVILGYSFTKRFTALCHLILGLGLSLAPIGAYLATGGGFDTVPILLSAAVLFWVSGFDIIYALQDEEFDKSLGLRSLPAFMGKYTALRLSELLHLLAVLAIGASVWLAGEAFSTLSGAQWLAFALFSGLLIYQHTLVSAQNLSRVNLAFFTTNGIASIVFGLIFILDLSF